jgi:tetratricopeptide (TPR) repeat protein
MSANAPDESAGEVAYHYLHAGAAADRRRAAPYLRRAGERALEVAAFAEAIRYFEQALALVPHEDEGAKADLFWKNGLAHRGRAEWDEAVRWSDRALEIYERLGDRDAVGRICAATASAAAWGGKWKEALKSTHRGLAAVDGKRNAEHCRLLCLRATLLAYVGDLSAAERTVDEAVGIAETLGDSKLLGASFAAKSSHHFVCMHPREAIAAGRRGAAELRSNETVRRFIHQLMVLVDAHFVAGQFTEMRATAEELAATAAVLNVPGLSGSEILLRATADFAADGDIDKYRRIAEQEIDRCRSEAPAMLQRSYVSLGFVGLWRGEFDHAVASFREAAACEALSPFRGTQIYEALAHAYAGRFVEAAAICEGLRADLPRPGRANSFTSWTVLLGMVETLSMIGAKQQAADLYPLVVEAIDTGTVVRLLDLRLLETVAGIAAAAGEDWQAAEGHFERALHLAATLPVVIEQPEVRRFYSEMLRARRATGDREKADRLSAEARELYARLGMPAHRDRVAQLGSAAEGKSAPLHARDADEPRLALRPEANVFCRQGDYWAIRYEGRELRLKDSKGLCYLAELLRDPGREWHVMDLVHVVAPPATDAPRELADTGAGDPVLDGRARAEYRRRLEDLRTDLTSAEQSNDCGRASRIREEIDFLSDQLASALRIGSRDRRAVSSAERARQAVNKAIKSALDRIRERDPSLGHHLATTIQTGLSCRYAPDPRARATWQV